MRSSVSRHRNGSGSKQLNVLNCNLNFRAITNLSIWNLKRQFIIDLYRKWRNMVGRGKYVSEIKDYECIFVNIQTCMSAFIPVYVTFSEVRVYVRGKQSERQFRSVQYIWKSVGVRLGEVNFRKKNKIRTFE